MHENSVGVADSADSEIRYTELGQKASKSKRGHKPSPDAQTKKTASLRPSDCAFVERRAYEGDYIATKMINMETSLTTWEAKERAGLLALETEEWRQKRLIAEDPNTTGKVLEQLSEGIKPTWTGGNSEAQSRLLGEAIIAHPNTPPGTLLFLFNFRSTHIYCPFRPYLYAYAIRRNPIAPLLNLEMHDFWERTYEGEIGEACQLLLREAALPLQICKTLTSHAKEAVAQSARFHILVSGEI